MVWEVFPHWVEEAYPWMPDVFQTAANHEQQVQEGESWLQLLYKIAQRSSEMTSSGKDVNNDDIAKAVLRSQPPNAVDVPDIVDYYQKYGGGQSQQLVQTSVGFARRRTYRHRFVYRVALSRH